MSILFFYDLADPVIKCLGEVNDGSCSRLIVTKEYAELQLKCTASGSPQPVSQWQKWINGTTVKIRDDILKVMN